MPFLYHYYSVFPPIVCFSSDALFTLRWSILTGFNLSVSFPIPMYLHKGHDTNTYHLPKEHLRSKRPNISGWYVKVCCSMTLIMSYFCSYLRIAMIVCVRVSVRVCGCNYLNVNLSCLLIADYVTLWREKIYSVPTHYC